MRVLHGHGTLAIRQVDHDEAVTVRLRGHTGLATEHVEGRPGRDRLLQAAQAAPAVGEHEVIERVRLEVGDELLGRAAVHIQCEPVVLDLWVGLAQQGAAARAWG